MQSSMRSLSILLSFAAVLLIACADDDPIATQLYTKPSLNLALGSENDYIRAGQILAAIMEVESNREYLLKAMRSSVWSEHKVDLASWISAVNDEQLNASLTSAGLDPEDARTFLASLPPSDLYVLGRDSRISWKSSQPIAVAGAATPDAHEVLVWRGRSSRVVATRELEYASPLLVLHPAEARGNRIDQRYKLQQGITIQEPDESDLGIVENGTYRWNESLTQAAELSMQLAGVTYDYGTYGTVFMTTSEKVNEIGGAEIIIDTNKAGINVNRYTVTGYERGEFLPHFEYAGPRASEEPEVGYFFEFTEDDPFDDDYIGFTDDNQTTSNGGNIILAFSENGYLQIGAYTVEAEDIPNLPPLIGANSQTTIYRGTYGTVVVNGDYFALSDLMTVAGTGVTFTNMTRTSPFVWSATATVSSAATAGSRDVTIARATTGLSDTAFARILIPAPLSVSISGPAYIPKKSTYTWEAIPTSGRPPYSYSWSAYFPGSGYTFSPGTTKIISMLLQAFEIVELTVTVSSSNGESVSTTLYIGLN